MSEKDRFFKALSHGGHEVTDVKFFLGENRDVTQEDIFREAANWLTQANIGFAKSTQHFDGDMPTVNINSLSA